MAALFWVIPGIVIALVYIPFVLGIETPLAGKPWGYPLLYLFTFFFWPIILIHMLVRISRGRAAKR